MAAPDDGMTDVLFIVVLRHRACDARSSSALPVLVRTAISSSFRSHFQ